MIYNFVILPINEQGGNVEDGVAAAEIKLAMNNKIIRSSVLVNSEYKNLAGRIGVASSNGAEFSQIISKLEGLAKEANIHVANVQPQQAINKEVMRIFPVEIDIDGSWPAIARFLYLAQAQPNSFNVDELNLERFSETVTSLRGRIVLSRARIASSN